MKYRYILNYWYTLHQGWSVLEFLILHYIPAHDILNTHLWCSDNLLVNYVLIELVVKTLYHIRKKIQLITSSVASCLLCIPLVCNSLLSCIWNYKLMSMCWFFQTSYSVHNFWGLDYFNILPNTLQLENTNKTKFIQMEPATRFCNWIIKYNWEYRHSPYNKQFPTFEWMLYEFLYFLIQ